MSFLQDLGALANPYGTPSDGEWNLVPMAYTNANGDVAILFVEQASGESFTRRTALEQVSDTGGRRLAVYEYPYRDGQAVDDLGRKGETYVFQLKFHGLNYQDKLDEFIAKVVNVAGQATLQHPVRGALRVRFREYELVHRHDEWNAVSARATFVEDNFGDLQLINQEVASSDSVLRSALQQLVDAQAQISAQISAVQGLLALPGAIVASVRQRLDSITGQMSRLVGQLAATFATDTNTARLAATAALNATSILNLSSGTAASTSGGVTAQSTLPPVFQVGFDSATQAAVESNLTSFVAQNQLTTSQAVFGANQARAAIGEAIAEAEALFGNYAYDIVLQYRAMAVQIQQTVESCVASQQSKVRVYRLPYPMSLRMVAFKCGLSPSRQNEIEALNPNLPCINWIPKGFEVTVPVV